MSRFGMTIMAMLVCVAFVQSTQMQSADSAHGISKLSLQGIPNPIRIHSRVISGGLPEGDEAFKTLADLGVKTIISVDGMKPDVATAKRHGLRYVHLPHGYDGVPVARVREIAKAIQELPGPVFIHCHHGRHRSPAASAAACIAAGYLDKQDGLEVLELAGTNTSYRGLFQSVIEAHRESDTELRSMQVAFVESAKLAPVTEAMIRIEKHMERLKHLEKSNWNAIEMYPDWHAEHESLLLVEEYTELLRDKATRSRHPKMLSELFEAKNASEHFEKTLKASLPLGTRIDAKVADAFESIINSCLNCHQLFRDKPITK